MKLKKDIVIVGAGHEGRIVADILKDVDQINVLGFLDDNLNLWGKVINGISVLGPIKCLFEKEMMANVTVVVAIGTNPIRISIVEDLTKHQITLYNAIHPSAVIMKSAKLGRGNIIHPNVVINSGVKLGDNVIVNTGAIVEHDCIIQDGVFISSNAQIGGRVVIEQGAFIASSVTIIAHTVIGSGSIIGAGSLACKDVPSGVLTYGVPSKVIEKVDENFDWSRLF